MQVFPLLYRRASLSPVHTQAGLSVVPYTVKSSLADNRCRRSTKQETFSATSETCSKTSLMNSTPCWNVTLTFSEVGHVEICSFRDAVVTRNRAKPSRCPTLACELVSRSNRADEPSQAHSNNGWSRRCANNGWSCRCANIYINI